TTPVSAKTAPGSRAKISIEARVSEPAMAVENIDTLVVGGGQAGLAMAEHLSQAGVPHIVLERHRIAERWRSERWDSLVANGPAWHDRFPGLEFSDVDRAVGPDDFAPAQTVADYFVAYARKISAPIRCGVDVLKVERRIGRPGFRVETSAGVMEADSVVAATGAFQRPVVPELVPRQAGLLQMHSTGYRNPAQLPDGAILVVGFRFLGHPDRGRTARLRAARLPLDRPSRSSAADLSRSRLLLVAGCPGQMGCGSARAGQGTCDDRRERRTRRPYDRLSASCRAGNDSGRADGSLRRRRDRLRVGPGRQS